jgi:hypothetical protein
MPVATTLEFEARNSLLIVRVTGTVSSGDPARILEEALAHCTPGRFSAVLIDVSGQTGTVDAIHRYRAAEYYGRHWPRELPLAMLEDRERSVQDYLFETVTSKCGIKAKVFCDLQEALVWLPSNAARLQPVPEA